MTPEELKEYCETYATSIKVRALVEGRFETVAYADLSPQRQQDFRDRWVEMGLIPERATSSGNSGQ